MNLYQRAAARLNALIAPLVTSPRWGWTVQRSVLLLTCTGRRTGRTISTPVAYRRRGPLALRISVLQPEQKTWWRNSTGAGGAGALHLRGMHSTGWATAQRDARGRVTVTVALPAPGEDGYAP